MHRLVFRVHAIQRMFQRKITIEEVEQVLATGEVIEYYPEDTPFPSRLMLGWSGLRPIHLVAANNSAAKETIVITVYEPELSQWASGFRRRKNEVRYL